MVPRNRTLRQDTYSPFDQSPHTPFFSGTLLGLTTPCHRRPEDAKSVAPFRPQLGGGIGTRIPTTNTPFSLQWVLRSKSIRD